MVVTSVLAKVTLDRSSYLHDHVKHTPRYISSSNTCTQNKCPSSVIKSGASTAVRYIH